MFRNASTCQQKILSNVPFADEMFTSANQEMLYTIVAFLLFYLF